MRLRPFVLALAIPIVAAVAHGDDSAAARAQLEAGYGLKEQGKYDEALPHLLESLRLDLQLKTLTNLADCEEHLGKLVDAQKHWVIARDRAGVEGNEKLRAAAEAKLSALEQRMPRLVIKLAPGSPQGAEVLRDGTTLGAISLGLGLPTDPGQHTLIVRAKGHADSTNNVTLGEAEQKEVVVSAGPEVEAPGPPPSETVSAEGPVANPGLGTQRKVSIVAASAGGVALILGTVFGVSAISAWGTAETDCGNGCSATSGAQTERSHAVTDATISTVGFIAGGVLLVGGAALWLTAPSNKEAPGPPPAAGGQVGVAIVPGVGGFSLRGVF
jgi:hypothetical protein